MSDARKIKIDVSYSKLAKLINKLETDDKRQ